MQSLIDKIQLGNAPPMEEVTDCPLCDSSESNFLFWNFDRFYHLPGKFGIVQCKNCSLVRLSPRPAKESLGFYYPQENYYSYQTPTVSIKNLSNRSFISRIREGIRQTVFDNLGYPVGKLSVWQKILQPLIVKLFSKQSTYGWGEKVHEIMVSEEECFRTTERKGYYVIHSVLPELRSIDEDNFQPALLEEYSSAADNLGVSDLRHLLAETASEIALFQ